MKNFETINKLWDYLSKCQICDTNRSIDLTVSLDENFQIHLYSSSFFKKKNVLEIKFQSHIEGVIYHSTWLIDCNTNKFGFNSTSAEMKQTSSLPSSDYLNLYFYLYADCDQCGSCANTLDLSISKEEYLTICNIGIERETFFIEKNDTQCYCLVADHLENKMYASNVEMMKRVVKKRSREITIPLLDLDFSNQQKILNKINTILLLK